MRPNIVEGYMQDSVHSWQMKKGVGYVPARPLHYWTIPRLLLRIWKFFLNTPTCPCGSWNTTVDGEWDGSWGHCDDCGCKFYGNF